MPQTLLLTYNFLPILSAEYLLHHKRCLYMFLHPMEMNIKLMQMLKKRSERSAFHHLRKSISSVTPDNILQITSIGGYLVIPITSSNSNNSKTLSRS